MNSYYSNELLQNHLSRYCNKRLKFFCDHCHYKTTQKHNLLQHLQAKHLPQNPSLHKCSKCKTVYSSARFLRKHTKICGQTKDYKSSLKRFCCYHCNYKADCKSILSIHIRAKHLPRDPSLNKCTKCEKSYSNRSNLLKHFQICGQTNDFKRSLMRYSCDHCEFKTHKKIHLSQHMQGKHLFRNPDLYKCGSCEKTYSYSSTLALHSKLCGKQNDLEYLSELKRFTCDHCGYKTRYKIHLSYHMTAKHLPRDPNANKCEKCGKSFSNRPHLLRHLKICGKPKRSCKPKCFYCDQSADKTVRKDLIASHMQSRHSNETFGCVACKKSLRSQHKKRWCKKRIKS